MIRLEAPKAPKAPKGDKKHRIRRNQDYFEWVKNLTLQVIKYCLTFENFKGNIKNDKFQINHFCQTKPSRINSKLLSKMKQSSFFFFFKNPKTKMNVQKNFKSLVDLLSKKKDSFFILGLCVLPILSITRILLRPTFEYFPFFSTLLNLFIFFLNLFLIYSILFRETFSTSLLSALIFVVNTKLAQRLLFFCLLFEQFLKFHLLILLLFIFSLICLVFNLYELYPESIYLFQFLLILFGIYSRFRKKILGKESLELAGIDVQKGAVTWKEVIDVVNFQLLGLQKSFLSPGHSTGPTSAVETARSLPVPPGEARIIQNQWPQRNEIVFPFFFYTGRRHVGFRPAFKTIYDTLLHSYQKAPAETLAVATSSVGVCGTGVYLAVRDQQKLAIKTEELSVRTEELSVRTEEVTLAKEVAKVKIAKDRVEVYQKNKELDIQYDRTLQEKIDRASKDSKVNPSDLEKLAKVQQKILDTDQLLEKSTADYEAICSQALAPSANLPASSSPAEGVSGLLGKKNVALLENGDSIGSIGVVQIMVDVFDSI